ncbi:hypothetical protein J4N45_10595 [Vibrio sp. SCSIO 43140]|uniref:hypothetical protein n=1 Tax=Vibrio sp. SCSIO 43140 TaxID=2819100 RepID=UPI0020763B43|nr:hypothetical protein [Vibrio sp. SCSIO 43140]USD58979.1 hypothetical protein J4N45_10595 [Vibrio sp. SCSIO 43140]
MTNELAQSRLQQWLEYGDHAHPEDPKLPMHPEFYYRVNGGWTSWNDFFKTPANSPAFEEHLFQDTIDEQAWHLYTQTQQ